MDRFQRGAFMTRTTNLKIHSFATERPPKTDGESLLLYHNYGFPELMPDSVPLFQQSENQNKHDHSHPLKIRIQGT